MKLLFIVEHFSMQGSGMENDVVNLCLGLSKDGYEIHICCHDGDQYYDIQLHYGIDKFEQIKKDVQPDLIIDWSFLAQADIYRVGGGIHEIYLRYYIKSFPIWSRWFKHLEFHIKKKHIQQIKLEKKITSIPNIYYSAISQMIADQLISYGVKKDFIQVAFNGVNIEKFKKLPDEIRQQQRNKWHIKEGEQVALFVAHNLRLKNLKFAIKVINALNSKGIPFKLAVCGKRRPLTLNPQIIYVGTTSELEKFYAAADILIHPSFYESFGNIILEAMACELPLITVDSVGASEMLNSQDEVFVCRPLSETMQNKGASIWADLINTITTNPNKIQELYKKRLYLEKNCSLSLFVKKFEQLIEQAYLTKKNNSHE